MRGGKRIALSAVGGLATVVAMFGVFAIATAIPEWSGPIIFAIALFIGGSLFTYELLDR